MKLTIFTPTYNRSKELPGLYKSIVKSLQFSMGNGTVDWLIVDDGSTEDITELVKAFDEVSGLSICFFKKKNGGKHTAYNLAIDAADGDFFVCIDDDDRLTQNALRDIFALGREFLDSPDFADYGAFVGRAINNAGAKLGCEATSYPFVSDTIEIRDKYRFWGEPEVHVLKYLKKYRFDVFDDERFLTEAALFDRMSREHKFLYTNYPMIVKTFHPDGLTAHQTKIRVLSPKGAESYYYQRSTLCKGFFINSKLS